MHASPSLALSFPRALCTLRAIDVVLLRQALGAKLALNCDAAEGGDGAGVCSRRCSGVVKVIVMWEKCIETVLIKALNAWPNPLRVLRRRPNVLQPAAARRCRQNHCLSGLHLKENTKKMY